MRKLLLATIFLALAGSAQAADMATKAPPVATPLCSTTQCTTWYVGAGIAGNGTNADIIGNGLSGSVFAGGGLPFIDVGYQLWNNQTFLGIEAGAGYELNVGTAINSVATTNTGYDLYQELQIGGNLSGIFGTPSAVTAPTGLAAYTMAPYVAIGVDERPFGTGWRTGAGIKFCGGAACPMIVDVGYRYVNYGTATQGGLTINADNLVFAKFDFPFK
jgi:opacity protein-like surface antigen